jgi:hypothetical protein
MSIDPCWQKLLSDKQIRFKEFCMSWNKFHKNLPRDSFKKFFFKMAVYHGFNLQSGQTKDYKIDICCFSDKHAVLRRKSKNWLARRWWWGPLCTRTNTISWIFIVLAHWNSLWIGMSPHSDTLSWFRANQFLFLSTDCFSELAL